jgi:RNA polymerase sigma-70 factor, ECF subfamily
MTDVNLHSAAGRRFEDEIAPFAGDLRARARRLTRSHADADDLVQDTLLHAYLGIAGLRADTNTRAWLMRIMRNRWIDNHRRAQTRPEILTDAGSDGIPFSSPRISHPSAEELVLVSHADGHLAAAWDTLPENVRLVMYYAYVEGFSRREIATLIGAPTGTVLSRLHRGRQRLRAVMREDPRGCEDRRVAKHPARRD